MSDPIVERFVSRLGAGGRAALAERDDLEERLFALVAVARGAWPELALDVGDFVEHLAARLPDDRAEEALGAVHGADLWLAAACARGVPGAADALEGACMGELEGVLRRAGGETRDELRQRVLEKLLVAEVGAAPRIADYAGRGPLVGWLKVVASRVAVDFLRARDPAAAGEDELLALPSGQADPELEHLRERYRDEFRAAVTEAAATLGARARNVLRLHYIDGLTMEQIAALHRVHRLTAVRWVTDARDGLGATTRRLLLQRYGLGRQELDSIVAMMFSRFDISIRGALNGAQTSGGPA